MKRFSDLPSGLRIFIGAHFFVLPWLAWAVLSHRPSPDQWWMDPLLILVSLVFSIWRVELPVFQGQMTVAFAAVCLTLLLRGEGVAIVAAALGGCSVVLCTYDRQQRRLTLRQPIWYRFLFNFASCGFSCGFAAEMRDFLAYAVAPHFHLSHQSADLLGLCGFTLAYFLINTLSVSLAVSLHERLKWLDVWNKNFVWTWPGYFASASLALGIQMLFEHMGLLSLVFFTPVWIVYYSYQLYMERVKQDTAHITELNDLNQAIIMSLAMAIDAKDRYTCSHINRVQQYAVALAAAAKLDDPDRQAVITGALVHDIGKLGIPDHILGKQGKLTTEEFKRIQSHVTIGAEILAPIPFPFPVVDVVLSHHERWDGLGYPRALKGEEIPIGGRIISIVDVYDALTSNRPYRRALSQEEAISTLRDGAGKQFDPRLVELFVQVLPQVDARIKADEAVKSAAQLEDRASGEGSTALVQISQAAAEMAAVADVAHSLAEQDTIDEIAAVVTERCLSLLPIDTAIIYYNAADGESLAAIGIAGKYADKLRGMFIQAGEGVSGWVAKTQQPRVNAPAALDVARRFSPEENLELNAASAVPIAHGAVPLGVLAVYTQAYAVLSDHHLNVLNIVAEHTAAAIQNTVRIHQQRELAYTDPLTNIINCRGLVREMDRFLEAASNRENGTGRTFSVIMIDLDRFKEVNDTYGHLRGDDLLRTVAQTLKHVTRASDVVCRYAGDEFVLLLPGITPALAARKAEEIRRAVDALPAVGPSVKVSASVGVARFPDDGMDSRALISAADQRMYEDKLKRRRSRDAQEEDFRLRSTVGGRSR